MLYPIRVILDIVFPPTLHEITLRFVSKKRFTHWYRPHVHQNVTCLSEYRLPEIQAAVAACKFENSYKAAELLTALVQLHLNHLIPKKTLLIPVPLSAKRLKKRTFNQVERVLHGLTPLPYSHKVCTKLIERSIDTRPQTSLARAERLTNMSEAFMCIEKNIWYTKDIERIIICDDVVTTGATLEAAKKELLKHVSKDIEILCLAWAH